METADFAAKRAVGTVEVVDQQDGGREENSPPNKEELVSFQALEIGSGGGI